MINWGKIHTVFLDMDGTLLDLHYDNHFWLEYVPKCFAETNNISIEHAKSDIYARYEAIRGTLNWYCVDYWSDALDLDIPTLKQEVDHLIAIHPHVVDFLGAVRHHDKRIVLVTNAHGKSISLKMERTQLGGYFDTIVSAHDIGVAKEDNSFWGKLQHGEPFDRSKTLFIDDSLPVLRSAQQYGIAYLLAIRQPDSKKAENPTGEFDAISTFREIIPKIID
ncbi:MAG: GMP/IMP nucleotidase [Gammaproteobacteria bacterium]|nr:MAG: GMP/IMP nucleotidase [Gammaproteobacteria bacterium]